MDIKELNSKKLYKEYEINIDYKELDDSINKKISEIIPTLTLPGFRKGKAPLNIARKKYEENILNEVMEKMVQEKIKTILEEKKFKVFRQPKVEIKQYKKNEPVILIIKIDLQPDIKIYPYDQLKLSKYKIKLDKKTIDENFDNFIKSQKKYIPIINKRKLKNTDKVFVNINTEEASVPEFIKSQNNVSIITDSDYQILPDLSSKLIEKGVQVGDSIKLKFDLKTLLKEKNKKIVEFNIDIISIEEITAFKIDKEFLDKNNFKTEKDFKEGLKENLNHQYQNFLLEIEKKQLMDNLELKNDFDVPEGILEEEFGAIWHKVEHAKKDNKLDEDDKLLTDTKLKERYKKIALRRVKLAVLLQFIANEEKISITEKELTDGMIQYASQYPGQEKQIFEYFKKNPASVESIRGPIFEKKIVDFILSKTKQETKNVSVDEFVKLQEKTFDFKKESKKKENK
ncbi:MAG: Trigger factor [Alphaproteobacteria bacterium MarineAlpha5_Bin7]|mgnify:CR=1 FL=1|nr:MAG: Trigger factor [Alphaproteobacteria bacterium MarineAlpha5_Bin7]|tara:strand:+ start:89 stop:1456 length:1368 start_codon:yes stop_codon:yes gene_type:complete